MATQVRIELNRAGVRELLRNDPGIRSDLTRRAERIAAAAGDGFVAHSAQAGAHRARAAVVTETWEAAAAEATHHTLTRAIDAGR
jgi:hypothetical protein